MISSSITQFSSSIFLVIMSADRFDEPHPFSHFGFFLIRQHYRFVAVCHPISSPRFRTPLVSKVVSLIAWGLSVVLMLPIILYSTTVHRMDGKGSCNIVWPSGNSEIGNVTTDDEGFIESDGSTFTLYTFTLGFAIPLNLILIFYYLASYLLTTIRICLI